MRKYVMCLLLAVAPVCALDFGAHGCWHPHMEVWGRWGDYRQGGRFDLFTPAMQDGNSILFVEGRLIRLKRQASAEAGVGYRRKFCSNMAWGVNGFADYTHSDTGFDYYQFSVGGEFMWNCWQFYANAYLPGTSKHRVDDRTVRRVVIDGTRILDSAFNYTELEQSYGGMDADVGYNFEFLSSRLRVWGGYFYYRARGVEEIQGPRARVHYEVDNVGCLCGSRLIAGFEWQKDAVRKAQAALLLGLRLPANGKRQQRCPRQSSICRRMGDPVQRELGPVLARQEIETEPTEELLANIYFVQQGGRGEGSQQYPTSLQAAKEQLVDGDIIFLLGAGGAIKGDTLTVPPHSRVLGFGDNVEVQVPVGEHAFRVMDLRRAGRAVLAAPLVLQSGSSVSGIETHGGIYGSGDLTIDRTLVRNKGVNLSECRQVTIQDSMFRSVVGPAISTVGGDIDLHDILIHGGRGGIRIEGAETMALTDSTIRNCGGYALHLIDSKGVAKVQETRILQAREGIRLEGGSAPFVFSEGAIQLAGGTLIEVVGTSGKIDFRNNALTQKGGRGVVATDVLGGELFVQGLQLDEVDQVGVELTNCDASCRFVRTAMTTTDRGTGIKLSGGQGSTEIEGMLEQNRGGCALEMSHVGGDVDLSNFAIANCNTKGRDAIVIDGEVTFGDLSVTRLQGGAAIKGVGGHLTLDKAELSVISGSCLHLSNMDVAIQLPDLNCGRGSALVMDGVTGSIALDRVIFTDSSCTLRNCDLDFALRGKLESSTGYMITVDRCAGNYLFDGTLRGKGQGIYLEDNSGAITLNHLQQATFRGAGINLKGNRGPVRFHDLALLQRQGDAVVIHDCSAPVTIAGGSITYLRHNLSNAIDATHCDLLKLSDVVIKGASGQAINVDHARAVELNKVHLFGATGLPSTGVRIFEAQERVVVQGCHFDQLEEDGIIIDNLQHQGCLQVTVANNLLGGMSLSSNALLINHDAVAGSEAHIVVKDNRFTGFDFNGISVCATGDGEVRTLIEKNQVSDIGFGHGMVVLEANGPTMHATVRDNRMSATGDELVIAKAPPSFGNPLMLNLINNWAPGYQLHSKSSSSGSSAFHLGSSLRASGVIIDDAFGQISDLILDNGNRNEKGGTPVKVEATGHHHVIDPDLIKLPINY